MPMLQRSGSAVFIAKLEGNQAIHIGKTTAGAGKGMVREGILRRIREKKRIARERVVGERRAGERIVREKIAREIAGERIVGERVAGEEIAKEEMVKEKEWNMLMLQ